MTTAETLESRDRAELRAVLGKRAVVLVGMMGSGKSSVGKRLAARLGLPFVDADVEIETAARLTIPEIFAQRGEAEFRDGERRDQDGRLAELMAPDMDVVGAGFQRDGYDDPAA